MSDFLGPLWIDGQPELVRDTSGRGWVKAREKQRTRHVVDDYGNAVMFTRRCATCLRWLPLMLENFAPRAVGQGGLGLGAKCNDCNKTLSWMYGRANRELIRERVARYRVKHKDDPDYARRGREARERWVAKQDPVEYLEARREASRLYWRKVRRDPKRATVMRENQRIRYRLNKEQRGEQMAERAALPVRSGLSLVRRPINYDEREYVPVGPLVSLIRPLLDAHEGPEVAFLESIGVGERQWRRWEAGEATSVILADVDEVLMALGLLWFDVFLPGSEGFEEARVWFEGEEAA